MTTEATPTPNEMTTPNESTLEDQLKSACSRIRGMIPAAISVRTHVWASHMKVDAEPVIVYRASILDPCGAPYEGIAPNLSDAVTNLFDTIQQAVEGGDL